jgi:hypothetical protein
MHQNGFVGGGLNTQGLETLTGITGEATRIIRTGDSLEGAEPAFLLRCAELFPASPDGFTGHEVQVEGVAQGGLELVEASLVPQGICTLHGFEHFRVERLDDGNRRVRQGLSHRATGEEQRQNARDLYEQESHLGFLKLG